MTKKNLTPPHLLDEGESNVVLVVVFLVGGVFVAFVHLNVANELGVDLNDN
jgi:hypothetical protein